MKSISIISEKEDDRTILMTGKYLENLKVFWKLESILKTDYEVLHKLQGFCLRGRHAYY